MGFDKKQDFTVDLSGKMPALRCSFRKRKPGLRRMRPADKAHTGAVVQKMRQIHRKYLRGILPGLYGVWASFFLRPLGLSLSGRDPAGSVAVQIQKLPLLRGLFFRCYVDLRGKLACEVAAGSDHSGADTPFKEKGQRL